MALAKLDIATPVELEIDILYVILQYKNALFIVILMWH